MGMDGENHGSRTPSEAYQCLPPPADATGRLTVDAASDCGRIARHAPHTGIPPDLLTGIDHDRIDASLAISP